jgi:hypothetical protein
LLCRLTEAIAACLTIPGLAAIDLFGYGCSSMALYIKSHTGGKALSSGKTFLLRLFGFRDRSEVAWTSRRHTRYTDGVVGCGTKRLEILVSLHLCLP